MINIENGFAPIIVQEKESQAARSRLKSNIYNSIISNCYLSIVFKIPQIISY